MTELTIKLIIILLPGAISTLIYGKLILHKEWDNFKFILYSILFGIFSYFLLQIIIDFINLFAFSKIPDLSLWNDLTIANKIPYGEITFSTIVSVILSYIVSLVENEKVISRIAKHFGVSNKYGDENLYSKFLNAKEVEYVYVRSIKNELTYYGWVKSFSESDNLSEICLAEVSVYNYKDSDHLYDVSEIYLSFNKQEIIIELANK
jgi:hypothetical protein